MKIKPVRHKTDNTFKFEPFAERIANIDVDIFHRVAHPNEELESDELECYFYQTIQKWNVLNLTESYDQFRKELYGIITLPQLIHKKDYVVEVLLKYLKQKNPLSAQPLLECVVAFAKDLRKEFYPYYPVFSEQLIDLLHTKDTELLEWLFTCLAYLFKFLWRYLIKDIDSVFVSLLPLLSDTRPDYINNFAAESFAFVARKVKDRKSFLVLILKTVESEKDGIAGCGKLLFEVIKGVSGNFHSCAESTLQFYFTSLYDDEIPQTILFEVLQEVINNILQQIHTKNSDIFWKSLIATLDQISDQTKILDLLLKLVNQTLQYKNGKFLKTPDALVKQYIKMIETGDFPENIWAELSKLAALLLMSSNIKLAQENASNLIRKTLKINNNRFMLQFVDNLTGYVSFEPMILPVFLKYYSDTLDPAAFRILIKLIMKKSPPSLDGTELINWNKYTLDFPNKNRQKVIDHILKLIRIVDLNNLDLNAFISASIILPHVTSTSDIVVNNIKLLLKELPSQEEKTKVLFLLLCAIECVVHLVEPEELLDLMNQLDILNILLELVDDYTIVCLRMIDLLSTACRDTVFISMDNLKGIDGKLLKNFTSPFHQVRSLTSHIYSLFEQLPEFQNNTSKEQFQVFTICHTVESIEPLVHTYRDQIQNLQKLTYDQSQSLLLQKLPNFTTIPLRYCLGALYINFQLLWEPIIEIIVSYAHGMPVNEFWNVFSNELKTIVDTIKTPPDTSIVKTEFEWECLEEFYEAVFKISDKPDYGNYRNLLWKAMASFADIAEARSRDVSTLLLAFIEDEYRKTNASEALTWNIKQSMENTTETDETEEDEDDEEQNKKGFNKNSKNSGKSNLKSLTLHLTLFTKIRSPKTMYREPELYKLYLDLLNHRSSEIQKLALDCIMVYKFKYLTPYQDHLYALIDDKKFRNELALFQIDKESTVVQPDHRSELIPIVLRLVYSKMIVKTGMRTGGKSSGQLRRNLVFRFISGCHEGEMMQFVQMAFKYYSNMIEMPLEALINSVDLEKCIPPKRLQSTCNLISVILEQFGGLMGNDLLKYLLKIVFVIGAVVLGAWKQKLHIHSGYLNALKQIRNTGQLILSRFFAHFDSYPWDETEINTMFDLYIWPWLDKLTTEGIHSPTTLTKLIHQFCLNPRYFNLLVKHEQSDKDKFILPEIINLLVAKIHPTVNNIILEMLEKLLSLKLDDNETAIVIDHQLPIEENILTRLKLNEELNYGSCILLPFVPQILEKFKKKLKNNKKGVNFKELFILSRISELVWEPEMCDTVLNLLLPVVIRRTSLGASDETIFQLITTVFNLIKMLDTPSKYTRKIAALFFHINSAQTRKLLCEILTVIDPKIAQILKELNAFDKKILDQPDFERRHKVFKDINNLIDTNAISVNLGCILIYNCFFIIRHDLDLALRESAGLCLRNLIPYLLKTPEKDYILNEILFELIRKGFRSKNDNYRTESISLLGHLARECADASVVLRDLSKFTNKADLEVDFFENMLHLQLYRQTRGLNKFNQICKELIIPLNPKTITQFILPLISSYLLKDKYASKNSLIDAAIDGVKIICQFLPWHQYESILKYYLGQLRYKIEFQKQLVRLTVAILDAYHFDLSRGKIEKDDLKKAKVKPDEKQDKTEDVKEDEKQDKSEDVNEDESEEVKEQEEQNEEVEIDEILDKTNEEEVLEVEEVVADRPAVERNTILCPSAAKRVIFSIKTILLPQLHKAMAEMSLHESSHKVNRKRTGIEREEQELQKVPISLAVVKLLQKLPVHILEHNLPGVFMKLCTFLKSPLDSVRRVTRETLQKIMSSLGPKYLSLLISEMSSLLSRGFQVHVLVYTTHAVLTTLKNQFQPTDIDKCLLTILSLCKNDLFGALADEREVSKIVTKTSEAKSTKSYDTFQILAQYITEKSLLDLMLPLKDILAQTHSYKLVNKVQETLRRIVLGLVDNTFIKIQDLLVFAYGTASESIPQFMLSQTKAQLTQEELEKKSREKEDCFIIPKQPVYRSGFRLNSVRVSKTTNAHLLVEFGLRLCFFILKRDKVETDEFEKFIDPFVMIFKNCLTSRHVKMCTLTIQCLSWVMKFDLPSMKENIKDISAAMFELLHKYGSAGLSKGDNFDLVVAAFKAMSILVRDVTYYTLTTDQLKALLLYAEQDLHDYERQATAFALLKAVIGRKFIIPELHDIMDKVAELSITSEMPHVRSQCRQVFLQFFMDYPLGKKLDQYLAFYMSQLNYEMKPGRESALEMIQGVINSFPMTILRKHAGMMFVLLGARLINDEAPDCRKMVAKCIQTMLERLPKTDRETLFDILITWFKDKKISHRRLAAQLCGLFITVEKAKFTGRLSILVPLIKSQFAPHLADDTAGKFVRRTPATQLIPTGDSTDDENAKPKDHQLFQLLQMLLKLCANCPKFLERTEDIEMIATFAQTLLAYPHEWVRISAAQFLGYVLSASKIGHLSQLLLEKKADKSGYLYSDPQNTVKSLTLDLCAQLQPGSIKSEFAEQVIKNLVFLARVLEQLPTDKDENESINLFWLTKRMRKIVNREIVEDAKSTVLRTEVFKWIAAVITTIKTEKILQVLHHLLAPLVREMTTTEEKNAPLRQLAREVGALMKKKIGTELYIEQISALQQQLNVRRAERKRERAQLAVTNPDIAAQKKIKLQEKKKVAKKRKIDNIKGKKFIKKKRKTMDDIEIV